MLLAVLRLANTVLRMRTRVHVRARHAACRRASPVENLVPFSQNSAMGLDWSGIGKEIAYNLLSKDDKEQPFNVLVCGLHHQGKSSLINTILRACDWTEK